MADDDRPDGMETKSTRNTLVGYTAAAVPNDDRTGDNLTDDERRRANLVVGSPAQGNAITNPEMVGVGDTGGGVTTASGGSQSESATAGTSAPSPSRRGTVAKS